MGLDATGHYVPASTDAPARSAFDKLSLSLRDPFPVADTAARTALLATLAAASPAVVPSASSPIFFYQEDLPAGYRTVYTVDGSNFISLSGAFVWADAAARTAATTMANGDKGYQVDTGASYTYASSAWSIDDTGWITPTLNAGWTAASGETPKYRRVNGDVSFQGRGVSTGANAVMFTVPVGFRQNLGSPFLAENGGAAMRCQYTATGDVRQVTAASAAGLSLLDFPHYRADA